MRPLRKQNGQFASISEQFTLMEKFSFCFGISVLLVSALLIVAAYAKNYALTVKEVWANMDNSAYERTIVVEKEIAEEPAVIMETIAKCESGGTHYKNNRVVMNLKNSNGTFDVGKFQINSEWEVTARKMGYDIFTPEGNEAFAYWLYDTRGTEDWYSSKHCWAK